MKTNDFESEFLFQASRIVKLDQSNDFVVIHRDMELNRSLEIDYNIVDISEIDDILCGSLQMDIKLTVKEKKSGKEAKKYRLNLIIEGIYSAPKSQINEEKFSEMLTVNGCASLYSVARAFIISLSSQTLVEGQIIIPLLNVVEMNHKKSESSTQTE